MQPITFNVNPAYRVIAIYHRDDMTGRERFIDISHFTDDEMDRLMEYMYAIEMMRDVNTGGEMDEVIESMQEFGEDEEQ